MVLLRLKKNIMNNQSVKNPVAEINYWINPLDNALNELKLEAKKKHRI